MGRGWHRSTGLLLLFGVVALAAVAIGAFVAASSGVPAAVWGRNLAAWAVGAVLATAIAGAYRPAFLTIALWAAPLGLAASFLSRDLQGVHRWIDIGPLHMNAAMLLAPAGVVALGGLGERLGSWVAALLSLGLLAIQPDASQALALASVVILIAATAVRRPAWRGALIVAAGVAVVVAWLRPDPLSPVPEVEGILRLAWTLSPAFAGAACLLLLAAVVTPAIWSQGGRPSARRPAWGLSLCLVLWAAAPMLGAFPVPLVGMGLSPILGAWLGVGLLAGVSKASQAEDGRRS